MRLAVVTNDYPPKPGGIQQYLGNLVDAWPDEVRVLAPRDGAADETVRGESVVRRGRRRFMWPTPGVARWVESELREFEPDAVLFGAPYPLSQLIGRVRRRVGVPVGVLGHGAEVTIPAALPVVRTWLGRTLAGADVRFTVSRYTQRRLQQLTRRSVVYVGAGVDLEAFTPRDRSTRGPGEPLVLGCVSRFVRRKRQDLVIEAAAELAAAGMAIRVLLVGKGRREAALRRLAQRSGVDVEFAVGVPWSELPDRYRSMDVFCMPCRSRWGGLEIEGLGLVFLEAAAAGLPVLAGSSGGAPETVVPGETGYLVHSAADIVDGVNRVLADPDRGPAMGLEGRIRVEREFNWAAVVERFEAGFAGVSR